MRKGQCVICAIPGPLTMDHVPPKGVVRPRPVLVNAFTNYISPGSAVGRPPFRTSHSRTFPTLCKRCNGDLLGALYDPALVELSNCASRWLRLKINHGFALPNDITVTARQAHVARAVIGHLLAADEQPQRSLDDEGPLQGAMRSFFLQPTEPPPPDLSVYLWPYPGSNQVLLRQFCISTLGEPRYPDPIAGGLLKFFPLAFLVTSTSAVVPGRRLGLLDLSSTEVGDLAIPLVGAPRQAGLSAFRTTRFSSWQITLGTWAPLLIPISNTEGPWPLGVPSPNPSLQRTPTGHSPGRRR